MKRRAKDALQQVQAEMGFTASEPSVADYATSYGGATYMSPPQSVLSTSTAPWFTTGTVASSVHSAQSTYTVEPSVYASVHASNRFH